MRVNYYKVHKSSIMRTSTEGIDVHIALILRCSVRKYTKAHKLILI